MEYLKLLDIVIIGAIIMSVYVLGVRVLDRLANRKDERDDA